MNPRRNHITDLSGRKADFSYEEFLNSLNLIVGLEQLLENLSAKLREMLSATDIWVMLYEPITERFVGKYRSSVVTPLNGGSEGSLREFSFTPSDRLIKWLYVNRTVLDTRSEQEVVKFLLPSEQSVLLRHRIVFVVPLIVINRLSGAFFVGEKIGGGSYSAAEARELALLANQSALTIEHARMVQFQEDRLQKLFHADKLTTIGELAAGAAHEIRNPLTSIRSTVQYLQKDLPLEKRSLIEGIIGEVDRIDQIIRGLLSFSKSSVLSMGVVDVEGLIAQTLSLLEAELRKHGVAVKKEVLAPDPRIAGDASQLKQVFLNVLLNGIQAMETGGVIGIRIADLPGQREYLVITISDCGKGIDDHLLPKVFEPFFTTREAGTGLGLSISYGIITRHGGEIEIRNNSPDPGATVILRLPRNMEAARG